MPLLWDHWSSPLYGTFVASAGSLRYVGPTPQLVAYFGLLSPQLVVGPLSPQLVTSTMWDLVAFTLRRTYAFSYVASEKQFVAS